MENTKNEVTAEANELVTLISELLSGNQDDQLPEAIDYTSESGTGPYSS